MPVHDLAQLDWTLEGWRPSSWRLGRSMETGGVIKPDIGPLPARVPGSVQANLRGAGLLPDWNVGLNSLACEWVEHRHWIFETAVPEAWQASGETVMLAADGLDYSGWVLVDDVEVGTFSGALVPHRFDLTESLTPGKPHRLAIVFDEPPAEQGQFGWTSRSRHFKPRYNYSWDWCPRIVPVGVWDALRLETGPAAHLRLERAEAVLADDLSTGSVLARVEYAAGVSGRVTAMLYDGDTVMAELESALAGEGGVTLELSGLNVAPWWPNGEGEPSTYELRVTVREVSGALVWQATRTLGFKQVRWLPCEGAPEGAPPWLCEVNGRLVFLQGANWVPPCASYAGATKPDYEALIRLYREMGCNVLRVWGGGILEKEDFYGLCDEAGILVWQEFPLSSSGIENTPPEAPDAIAELVRIARSYLERRAHHVSLLCWCGGNELTYDEAVPVDETHPCIAALAAVAAERDPARRFLPTSPAGPRFAARKEDYGKGLHFDIHGPWGLSGFQGLADWHAYWEGDDALFRSEVGMPGASPVALLERYHGNEPLWPPTGAWWLHGGAWWTQWERVEARFEGMEAGAALTEYVRVTQAEQAEAYATAARACKSRFPRCGGFIIWMGHDCFPCPANNSVIDFDREPKPAWHALREAFLARPENL